MNHAKLSAADRRLLHQVLSFLLMLLPSGALACLQPSPAQPLFWTALLAITLGMLLAVASP